MLCLNERKTEFADALKRAASSTLKVNRGLDQDSFVVVNKTTKREYRVKLTSNQGTVLTSCDCPDHVHRQRICKHISEVLTDVLISNIAGL